jgi:hypothetical protein
MADLNKQLLNVNQKTARLKEEIMSLLRDYEGLYHESNGLYLNEKVASNNEGLEDFYILLQTIRRNRDVVGSVFKGLSNIRSTERFKFVEEEVSEKKPEQKKQRKTKGHIEVPPPSLVEISPVVLQGIKEPEVING